MKRSRGSGRKKGREGRQAEIQEDGTKEEKFESATRGAEGQEIKRKKNEKTQIMHRK
jgi:hypothetical protein